MNNEQELKFETYCVLIRTYNSSQYVLHALKSVAAQSVSAELIIISDDHSSDNTKSIVLDYQDDHPELNILLVENKYRRGNDYNFLNALDYVDQEKIKYVAVLDSDDIWHPRKQEYQLKQLSLEGAQVAYTNNNIINTSREIVGINANFQKKFYIDQFISNSFFCFSSLVFPSQYIKEFELCDKVIDFKLVINLHKSGLKFTGIDQVLLSRRIHGSNDSKNKLIMAMQRFRVLWGENKLLSFQRFLRYAYLKIK